MLKRNGLVRKLFFLFWYWKIILLVIAAISPGTGYDTSSSLCSKRQLPFLVHHMSEKLTRWDALYYTSISNRGYLFEHEWAFGWGMTRLIAYSTIVLEKILSLKGLESVAGIIIAHIFHFLSVIILFYLTLIIFPKEDKKFAFISACLLIISPAGIFLSAPYAEAPCAFFSFTGCLAFTKSHRLKEGLKRDLLVLASGLCFCIATTFRSTGISYGSLLLEEAIRTLWRLRYKFRIATLRHFIVTGTSGLFVASGLFLPQYIAYTEFCADDSTAKRPWCLKTLPSVYTFVQSHYWNVGLFRYWKISNLPLFIIALPMYSLMLASGLWAINLSQTNSTKFRKTKQILKRDDTNHWIQRNMALSQVLIAVGIFTSAHVQIITRISSSFATWIWFIASLWLNQNGSLHKKLVSYMVIYSMIQAGLYSSFLPPA